MRGLASESAAMDANRINGYRWAQQALAALLLRLAQLIKRGVRL